MDWADDVAYSVHDLEDGVRAGLVDLQPARRSGRARRAGRAFPRGVRAPVTRKRCSGLRAAPWWPELHGAPRTAVQMAALKTLTSELIARLARAAVLSDPSRVRRRPAFALRCGSSSSRTKCAPNARC